MGFNSGFKGLMLEGSLKYTPKIYFSDSSQYSSVSGVLGVKFPGRVGKSSFATSFALARRAFSNYSSFCKQTPYDILSWERRKSICHLIIRSTASWSLFVCSVIQKDDSRNGQENNRCLLSEPYKTHTCTVWVESITF